MNGFYNWTSYEYQTVSRSDMDLTVFHMSLSDIGFIGLMDVLCDDDNNEHISSS